MFSAAIVVFREVFEIVLIVSVILAATEGIPHRRKSVGFGIGAGLAGAALVALFTKAISNLAEGMGQEIFSAGVLFTASLVIGWTVLWMKKHAREMKAHFTKLGEDVSTGNLPYFSLALVIALTVLREGSEIVLFCYGMLVSGQTLPSLLAGGAIGVAGGLAVGILLYQGLIHFPTRHFFTFTTWVLVLLVAGMTSQGVGFLTAAGMFGGMAHMLWDSSWLLKDSSVAGQSLKVLIGYTARPTEIQVLAYSAVLLVMISLLHFANRPKKQGTAAGTVAAAIILCVLAPGQAWAVDKLDNPYVVKGEAEAELNSAYDFDHRDDRNGAMGNEFEFEYGVTDRWKTELSGSFERENTDSATSLTELSWENELMLTEPGEYWLDAAIQGAYVHSFEDDSADSLEENILLEKDIGHFANLANINFAEEIGNNADHGVDAGFAWNTRYRYSKYFEPGIEWHSDFGIIGHDTPFNEQEHVVGPAVYGTFGHHINYQVGYFAGLTSASPDSSVRANLEYEWHF